MSYYHKSLGILSKGCGEDGIEVKIDYKKFYTEVPLYNLLFSSQYGRTGNRATRGWRGLFKDTSFFFQPFEIIELLLAFTLMKMKGSSDFHVNGKDRGVSKIDSQWERIWERGRKSQDESPSTLCQKAVNAELPGFRPESEKKALNYITSNYRYARLAGRQLFGRSFGGGNRNTLKKQRKRISNKRQTRKRKTRQKRTRRKTIRK